MSEAGDIKQFEDKSLFTDWEEGRFASELLFVVLVVTVIFSPQYQEMACTGTLIRANMVLTTASCLMDLDSSPNPLHTRVFSRADHMSDGLRAIKIFVHPRYFVREHSRHFDFAVIMIERSQQSYFPALSTKCEFHREDQMTNCRLAGYGDRAMFDLNHFKVINFNQTQFTILKCRGNGPPDTCWLCLNFPFIMPCKDDVGSPLICDGELVALYSPRILYRVSVRCVDTYVTYFSYVYNAREWMEAIVSAPEVEMVWLSNSWYFLLLCVVVLVAVAGIYLGLVEVMQRTAGADIMENVGIAPETQPVLSSHSLQSRTSERRERRFLRWQFSVDSRADSITDDGTPMNHSSLPQDE